MTECTSPAPQFLGIDHIAVAVRDLDMALAFFCNTLGFSLMRRREIKGSKTGMVCVELEHNDIRIVLCQGTTPDSQVSKLVESYGPGIAHIAFLVDDVQKTSDSLRERGMEFDTSVISAPGLTQVFSTRDINSGFSFEFISRNGVSGFAQENIQELFDQLEQSGKF